MTAAKSVAIVTGGGNGIGRAAALGLAADGAFTLIVDVQAEVAAETVRLIHAAGGTAAAETASVADLSAMLRIVAECRQAYGRIDILINNAGVGGGEPFEDVSEAIFDRLFEVNVKGAFFLTQAVVPAMKTQRFGRIVNVSSLIAARGTVGNSHYAGAKAALFGFTRSWAIALAPYGITVNTVVPALTVTPMATAAMSAAEMEARAQAVPMGRLALPSDLAPLIRFLCSPAAGFITGQAISANGAEFVGAL